MIAYPGSLPCPSRVEGHSAAVFAGLVRTPMEAGNTRQRRAFRSVPHQIALVFMVDQALWAAWLSWVNAHAWDEWITVRLPGLKASAAGAHTAAVPIRFSTDLQTELVPVQGLWMWRARVSAEYLPLATDLLALSGVWIIGGTPAAPAADWIIGGTPAAPAVDFTNPGTLSAPVVII